MWRPCDTKNDENEKALWSFRIPQFLSLLSSSDFILPSFLLLDLERLWVSNDQGTTFLSFRNTQRLTLLVNATRFSHPMIAGFSRTGLLNIHKILTVSPAGNSPISYCMLCYVKRCLPQIWGVVCYRQIKLVVVRQFNEFTAKSVTRRLCKPASAQVQKLYSCCPDQRRPWLSMSEHV